jgi:hypothetical protein
MARLSFHIRFSATERATIEAACGPDESLAAFIREAALKAARRARKGEVSA